MMPNTWQNVIMDILPIGVGGIVQYENVESVSMSGKDKRPIVARLSKDDKYGVRTMSIFKEDGCEIHEFHKDGCSCHSCIRKRLDDRR